MIRVACWVGLAALAGHTGPAPALSASYAAWCLALALSMGRAIDNGRGW